MELLSSARWLPRYRRTWFRSDVAAGIALAALLIPEALGYAGIAGLPPQSGLYATAIGLGVYALFGSSRQLAVSPTSSSAAILAASVSVFAAGNRDNYVILAATVAILVGIFFLLAAVLRLGFVSDFVSRPVLKGFVFGIAVTILIKQAPKLIGIERGSGNTMQQLWYVIRHVGELDRWTTVVGAIALVVMFTIRHWARRVPGAVVVLVGGVLAVRWLGLEGYGVHLVGTIPAGLPRFRPPDMTWADIVELIPASLGLMLVLYAEALGAARTFALKNGYEVNANTELYALGMANVSAGLFGGMVVGGGTSGTAMNDTSGAKTEVSTLVAACGAVLTLLFLTQFFRDLPEAVLAAIVIHAVWHLIDLGEMRRYARIRPGEFQLALIAVAGVLVFGILDGLVLAVGLTLVFLMKALTRPHLAELGLIPETRDYAELARHPEAEQVPGLLIVRLDGFVFFATADYARRELEQMIAGSQRPLKAVLFNMEVIPDLDITGLDTLTQLSSSLNKRGMTLLLARVKDPVRDVFERSGTLKHFGAGNIFRHVDEAVAAYRAES